MHAATLTFATTLFQTGEVALVSTVGQNTTADSIRCLPWRPACCQLQHHRTQGLCVHLHLRQRGRPPDQCLHAHLSAVTRQVLQSPWSANSQGESE
eukprot:10328613-Karenia_brevis.AAC.1